MHVVFSKTRWKSRGKSAAKNDYAGQAVPAPACMAMTRKLRTLLTFSAFIALAGGLYAADLRKVWQFDLASSLASLSRGTSGRLPVLAMRFSPDGRRLAVEAGTYLADGRLGSHLIILNVDRPAEHPQRYDLRSAAIDSESSGQDAGFAWSPQGDMIVVGGTLLSLADGRTCELPPMSVFLSEERLAAVPTSNADEYPRRSTLVTFGTDCHEIDRFDLPGQWLISDSSVDRGLLLLGNLSDGTSGFSGAVVVRAAEKKVVLQLGKEMVRGRFADWGKALCVGRVPVQHQQRAFTCYNADTGEEVGAAPTISGGGTIASAIHSSRVVASDVRIKPMLFLDYNHDTSTSRRVVWDIHERKEVAEWKPGAQDYESPTGAGRIRRIYSSFAISSDGKSITDGGNGVVRLYRLLQ
jgi:hypothetical protein